jgi:hypothetical protein
MITRGKDSCQVALANGFAGVGKDFQNLSTQNRMIHCRGRSFLGVKVEQKEHLLQAITVAEDQFGGQTTRFNLRCHFSHGLES